jgi:hypothetical protein
MGRILKNWRVLTAGLFAVVIIGGAYFLARDIENPQSAQASTETMLLKAIATKDSDNDGLTDWEESLYGTDPRVADSFNLGITDGQAVKQGLIVPKSIVNIRVATSSDVSQYIDPSLPPAPAEGTLTDVFARNFLSLYLTAKQNAGDEDLSEDDLSNISNQALNSLSSAIAAAPDFKSAKDLTVSGSGADALRAFAASAEAVLMKNKSNATTSEIIYLQNALLNNDSNAFQYISSIAKVYRDSAVGLSVLPVPKELAQIDLALINAMMRMGEITSDFTRSSTDPLVAMLALQQYPQAAQSLGKVFIDIGGIYSVMGVTLSSGTPGASFVNVISDITTSQESSKKKQ